jgi:hypothetical protein
LIVLRGDEVFALRVMKSLKHVLLPCVAFLLASCYETKQEITLNPDGTGKMRLESSFQNVNIGNQDDSPEEALQAAVGRIVNDSKGVDVWDDVSFKQLDDGRVHFAGTAYFKKIESVEIPNLGMFDFKWTHDAAGKGNLSVVMNKSDEPDEEKQEQPKLTDEEKAKKIKEERAKFQQSKPMMAAMLGGLKQTVDFRLPGNIVESSNFKRGPLGTLGLTFEGGKMIEAIDKLMADDEWLGKNGFDPQSAPEMDNEFCGLIFGEKAPVSATATGAKQPLFDYAAETAAARKGMEALQKKLGGVSIAAPAQGGQIKSIKVVGARIAREVDKKLDLRPFHQEPGYTLSVLVEFPGSILDITDKSVIESAFAGDGSSLIKGNRDWDRRLGFPKLSADQASAIFDVELKMPPPGVRGIKEIAGVLQYRVSMATKETDLGPMELKTGSKSDELGASIEEIKDGWKEGTKEMELKLKLKPADLKAVHLVENGVKTELKRSGYSGGGNTTVFTFQIDGDLPEKASLIVETYDKIQTFDAPFTLENLSLLGEPIGPGA